MDNFIRGFVIFILTPKNRPQIFTLFCCLLSKKLQKNQLNQQPPLERNTIQKLFMVTPTNKIISISPSVSFSILFYFQQNWHFASLVFSLPLELMLKKIVCTLTLIFPSLAFPPPLSPYFLLSISFTHTLSLSPLLFSTLSFLFPLMLYFNWRKTWISWSMILNVHYFLLLSVLFRLFSSSNFYFCFNLLRHN